MIWQAVVGSFRDGGQRTFGDVHELPDAESDLLLNQALRAENHGVLDAPGCILGQVGGSPHPRHGLSFDDVLTGLHHYFDDHVIGGGAAYEGREVEGSDVAVTGPTGHLRA